MKYTYVLAAFTVDKRKSIKYQEYSTPGGVAHGVIMSFEAGADYISLRRIRHDESS